LRSKLNHAVEATDVKLAVSKTALGLYSVFTFPDRVPTDNRNLLKISTSVRASRLGCNCLFPKNVKNFWRCAQIEFDSIQKNFIL
jgi:hypothetical protein